MRVIAGTAKGKRLKSPKSKIRPLTDQVKEALFNILGAKVVNCSFLDLFAGTGSVGIEALSRGAKIAIFIELNRPTVSIIRENLGATGFSDRSEVYAVDVIRALNIFEKKNAQFDIVFMGAPYDSPVLENALIRMGEGGFIGPDGKVVAEHRKHHLLQKEYGKLKLDRESRYGETVLSFYHEEKA